MEITVRRATLRVVGGPDDLRLLSPNDADNRTARRAKSLARSYGG